MSSIKLLFYIADTADYCPTKYFNVSCPTGSVILMNSAHYGRMPSGKCAGIGYGRCSVSVLSYMHARCTARTRCSVYVSNPDLLKMNPCSRDLAVYLRANHTCVAGMNIYVTVYIAACVSSILSMKQYYILTAIIKCVHA